MSFFTMRLTDAGVELLDQRRLPGDHVYLTLSTGEEVARAIEDMVVRGAPAIGVTAAMGVAVELRRAPDDGLAEALEQICSRLSATRPTAVNLSWALERVRRELLAHLERGAAPSEIRANAERLARELGEEDERVCRAIGDAGAPLLPEKARVLTHCNAGALATAGYGTALGVVRCARADSRR